MRREDQFDKIVIRIAPEGLGAGMGDITSRLLLGACLDMDIYIS